MKLMPVKCFQEIIITLTGLADLPCSKELVLFYQEKPSAIDLSSNNSQFWQTCLEFCIALHIYSIDSCKRDIKDLIINFQTKTIILVLLNVCYNLIKNIDKQKFCVLQMEIVKGADNGMCRLYEWM